MYDPPAGHQDMLDDAERTPNTLVFQLLEVPTVGEVWARKPMPNSIPALAMASNSKISDEEKQNYLTMFVQNHLGDDEYERVLAEMMMGSMPPEAVELIARQIATWGTARPTSRSARSAR